MIGEGRTRAARTRGAILAAFNQLFLERRQRRIGVAAVTAQAGVGRSTFYDHFAGVDALRLAALQGPFALLAEAAAGRGEVGRLTPLLAHFWENRARARSSLTGRAGEQAERLLCDLVEQRLEGELTLPRRLAAEQMAGAAVRPLRAWLLGEAPASAETLAGAICHAGDALAAAVREPVRSG